MFMECSSSVKRGVYYKFVQDNLYCRHVKNMSPIERRYVEALLDDAIIKHGIGYTSHSLKRMKERNLTKGRIHTAIKEGRVQEVQFDADGVKFLIAYATPQQYRKGYFNYVCYDINTGNVISLFNKQRCNEEKAKQNLDMCKKKQYILTGNCLTLLHKFLDIEPSGEEVYRLVRKYDSSNLDINSEKKLDKLRFEKTSISQL